LYRKRAAKVARFFYFILTISILKLWYWIGCKIYHAEKLHQNRLAQSRAKPGLQWSQYFRIGYRYGGGAADRSMGAISVFL
jgi:hypothetical protein